MSQAKVDAYKEEKKNRKKNVAKEKRKKLLWKIFGPIIAIVVIAGIGVGVYFIQKETKERNAAEQGQEIDYDELMKMIDQSQVEVEADDGEEAENNVDSDSEESTETELSE